MATKTISIMDDVYDLMARRKRESESFSDMLRRELKSKKNIMDCAGAWADISDKKIDEMKDSINKLGKGFLKGMNKRVD